MRQRRVKGIEERLSVYADMILRSEAEVAGPDQLPAGRAVRWYQRGSSRYTLPEGFSRVYAEFGCGRGRFINTLAAADPEGLYIGIEGCKTIVIRALAKARAETLLNVRCVDDFVNDAHAAFGENALDGVFLNFSDPWPKDRHAERRLTAPRHAEAYFRALKPGGFAAFKTDGETFFDYSLAVFAETGFHIEFFTRDLPSLSAMEAASDVSASGIAANPIDAAEFGAAVQTEYEQKFRVLGRPIYYFKATKPFFRESK